MGIHGGRLGSAPVYKGGDYNPQVMGSGPQTDTEPVFNETSTEMDYQLVPITSDQIKQFGKKIKVNASVSTWFLLQCQTF